MLELVESRVMDKLFSVDESKIDSPQEIKKMVQAILPKYKEILKRKHNIILGIAIIMGTA